MIILLFEVLQYKYYFGATHKLSIELARAQKTEGRVLTLTRLQEK